MSVLRTGRGHAGGGGGEVKFLTEKKNSAKKCSWGLKTGGGGGRILGCLGRPRPHPGVARGRKTIHFFL